MRTDWAIVMLVAAGLVTGCGEEKTVVVTPPVAPGGDAEAAADGGGAGSNPADQAVTLDVTAENAKIQWIGTKDDGRHDGGFETVTGSVLFVASDLTSTRFTLSIDTNSLYSDTDKLTDHLKSPDFFEVKSYPTATFNTTRVATNEGADSYTVTGDLTLHGVTKSISFPATISWADETLTVSAEFKIKRQDFGITYGPGKIHDDVSITATFSGTK